MIKNAITFFTLVALISCDSSVEKNLDSPVLQTDKKNIEPQNTIATPIKYEVVESFNVGNNVVVRALTNDMKNNRLWVGTTVGVLEVDVVNGNVINTFTRENGLANEYVFSATIDSKGGAWVGTNGGGVSYLFDKQWQTFFPMHGLGDYWVYSFQDQKNSAMWVGTWNGLSRFDYATKTFKTYVKELVNEWVYGLALDSNNNLWIGTEGGVNKFDGKTWTTWTHNEGLGAQNIQNLPFSENTGLGTRNRHDLSVLSQGSNTFNPNYVFCIEVDVNDVVWAGTWGGGVSFFNGSKWQNFTSKDGLAADIVYSMATQKNGVMWFGTNNGLSLFDGKHWQTFRKEDGLLDNHVYAVSLSSDGRVWVGTKHGVAVLKSVTEQPM